jgi:hypothetical protein
MSSDLHPFHGTFVYENSRSKVAIKEVSGIFVLNLQVFAQKVGFISGSHSVDGTQILQHCTSCWLISVATWSQSWVYGH